MVRLAGIDPNSPLPMSHRLSPSHLHHEVAVAAILSVSSVTYRRGLRAPRSLLSSTVFAHPLHNRRCSREKCVNFGANDSVYDEEGEARAGGYVWRPKGNRHIAKTVGGALVLSFFIKPIKFLSGDLAGQALLR